MRFRTPETDEEVRWLALRYEEIGASTIPAYEVTDEGLEEAEGFIRAQLLDESWRVLMVHENGEDGGRAGPPEDDEPIGMMICHLRNSPLDRARECSVDALHVESRARRHGVGQFLIEEAERWGVARGAVRIRTYVARENDPMHKLCRGLGFTERFVELGRSLVAPGNSDSPGPGAEESVHEGRP